jgi:hypothetical protein
MFKYQELVDLFPTEKVNSAIKRMADCYDLTGNYYDKEDNKVYYILNGERLLKKYFELSSEFIGLLDSYAHKECDEELSDDLSFFSSVDTPENKIEYQKERICLAILDYLKANAKKIIDNREHLRIPVGGTVVLKECMLSNKYLGKVEFYKDGGWGIAEEDGTVLVKNHLTKQPSKTNSLYSGYSHINTPYRIIQDRDTNKYGILSYETFHETIHCLYDKIEVVDFYEDSTRHFFIKAMKNKKWGCFDERCALIVDFEYDVIQLISGFLECIREAEYLLNESLSERDRRYMIEGKRDLFNEEGTLLIGGYDNLIVDYKYFEFYFGTSYEYYEDEETDFQGYPVPLSKVCLNYEKSICLVLDKEFKTIINNGNGPFRMPKWHKFHSPEEVEMLVPSGFLFKSAYVDLSNYDAFIYLYNSMREQYVVPEYIKKGFASPEEHYNYEVSEIKKYNEYKEKLRNLKGDMNKEPNIDMPFDYSESTEPFDYPYKNSEDLFVDESVVTIVKLNDKKEIEWIDYAHELVEKMFYPHIYRKGDKYGIFDWNGLKPALYDAITRESPDEKTYVASFEFGYEHNSNHIHNPNYIYERRLYIHYYLVDENGNYVKVEDDWKVFNPRECKWYPYDFITRYYGDYDEGPSGHWHDRGYEWTDEDAWDAMTDGMYGDYPGSGWDPEAFGY